MGLLSGGDTVARYTILGNLATGGMSEVYLARQREPSGFSKIVVLKVILPHLAEEPKFVKMFQNEAKLAASINHPGVVQIFDCGVEGTLHYMAMEYIDGRNLNRILGALIRAQQLMPIPIALRIVAEAASALTFAHGLADANGVSLQIIHRDVSLENILCTYTGQVKIVDFGIAKARSLESFSTQGTLKGKCNYIAPEHIEGHPVDQRIDIYSLGVVLYRLITGQLPFAGGSQVEILHRILHKPPKPPSELRPRLAAEVERIILRALAKDRERRYQRAADLQADLESYLQKSGSAVTPFHLSSFMAELFPPGSDKDRETYRLLSNMEVTPVSPQSSLGEGDLAALTAPHQPQQTGPFRRTSLPLNNAGAVERDEEIQQKAQARGPLVTEGDRGTTPGYASPQAGPIAGVHDTGLPLPFVSAPDNTTPRSNWPARRLLIIGGSAAAVLMLAGVLTLTLRHASTGTVQAAPDSAVRGHLAGTVGMATNGAVSAGPPARPDFRGWAPDRRAASTVASLAGGGILSVQSQAPAEVLIDGKRVGRIPLSKLRWPAGRYRLTVRSTQQHFLLTHTVNVQPGRELDLTLAPRKGQLRILVRPWAVVTLDGEKLGTTPLPSVSVYEGPHQLELENASLRVKKSVRVVVKADREQVVKVHLSEGATRIQP